MPRTAEEIFQAYIGDGISQIDFNKSHIIEAIEQAQREAVKYTLKEAADNAEIDVYDWDRCRIDKSSILNLAPDILKTLKIENNGK